MNHEDFLKFHNEFTTRMRTIAEAKNRDYAGTSGGTLARHAGTSGGTLACHAGGGGDAFANFRLVEDAYRVTSTEIGMFTRMSDKLSRIASFLRGGILQVISESAEDTLLDLANYCVLMTAWLRCKKFEPMDLIADAAQREYMNGSITDVVLPAGDETASSTVTVTGDNRS